MTRTMTLALSFAILTGAGLAGCETDDPPAPRDAIGGGGTTGDAAAGGASGSGGKGMDAAESDASGDVSDAGAQIGTTAPGAAFTIYPQADGGANPAINISGSAKAWDIGGGKMRIDLVVSGLLPSRPFGAHVHKLPCDMNMAGGHYQHNPAPDLDAGAGDGGPNDPAYANATNEAWLDFTTDGAGAAMSSTTVDWVPEAAKAKSIVIHNMATAKGGVAGPKLACLGIAFQ